MVSDRNTDDFFSVKLQIPAYLVVRFFNKVVNKTGTLWDGKATDFKSTNSTMFKQTTPELDLNNPKRMLYFDMTTQYVFVCPVDNKTYSVTACSFREYNTKTEQHYFRQREGHSFTIMWIRFVMANLASYGGKVVSNYCYKMLVFTQMQMKNLISSRDRQLAALDLTTAEGVAKQAEITKAYEAKLQPYIDLCNDLDLYRSSYGSKRPQY